MQTEIPENVLKKLRAIEASGADNYSVRVESDTANSIPIRGITLTRKDGKGEPIKLYLTVRDGITTIRKQWAIPSAKFTKQELREKLTKKTEPPKTGFEVLDGDRGAHTVEIFGSVKITPTMEEEQAVNTLQKLLLQLAAIEIDL